MTMGGSLRQRLMVLILAPLLVIVCVLGLWRYTVAVETAEELFDRSLLAATLAISRDVTISGGDALSVTTRDLVDRSAGGRVFYHVAGPDRAYVTGYAYPPIPPPSLSRAEDRPQFYESTYRQQPVRALRMIEPAQIGPVRGQSIVTVWQERSGRDAFARGQALRSAILLGVVVLTVAAVIWFGVNRGLRPLLDLESAIAARSSDDLSQIRRSVPREVNGIVTTLNALFGQVRAAIQARDVFISNAAHQLRNPVAGMLALAEAAEGAVEQTDRAGRLADLRAAAARTARLTTQMLALERIKGGRSARTPLDLGALVEAVATRNAERVLNRDVALEFRPSSSAWVRGDSVMLEEAIENLIDNALNHGGPGLSRIVVEVTAFEETAVVSVRDDGRGLDPTDADTAFERFGQVHPSTGSGLGLAIVQEVASAHGAQVSIDDVAQGASVSLRFARIIPE